LTEDERRAEIHKQKLLLFDRDSERRTRVFDDQADYFSTETEAWLDPAELAARRKLRAEAEAARQRQRSTLTLTFDFAGRQVVSHAGDADRAVLDKRFGVAEQPQSQGDAEMEKRLAAELDAVERIKLLSINDKEKTAASSVITTTTTIAAKSQSNEPDISLSTEPIAPLRIKPSDNIEMRPIALAREHDDSQATSGATKKKNDKKKKKKNENKQKKNNAEKSKHEKVQSAHDELF
jgi:hypothetical protein